MNLHDSFRFHVSAYVNIQDDVSGFNVSGTEAFIVMSLVMGLFLVSLVTTVTCLFIIFKLQLFPGSELITFDSQNNVLFRTNTDLNNIHLSENIIRGIEKISGKVQFQAGSSRLSVNSEGIKISADEGFRVTTPTTGQTIFPPDFSSLVVPSSLSSLTIENGAKNVKKIRSSIDQDLVLESGKSVNLRGNQGVKIDSKAITFSSPEIHVISLNSSITFEAAHGQIYWTGGQGAMPKISKDSQLQYKLCICSKSGRVFKLQMKTPETSCADVRFPESINPCS